MFENVVWITAKESWLTQEGIKPFESQYPLVSLDDLLNTIIEVLRMDTRLYRASPQRKEEEVKKVLGSTSCLLIVDNLETVQDRTIIQFLTKFPPGPSKALVTTRLGGLIASNAAVAQTLTGQCEIRIGPLSQEDAITLFLRRAKKQGLQISKEEHFAQLQDVINRTACIPLAIEWIIGRMG